MNFTCMSVDSSDCNSGNSDFRKFGFFPSPEIPEFSSKIPEIRDFQFLHYLLEVACFVLLVNSVTCVSCVVVLCAVQ
jgi:hypothetical protein